METILLTWNPGLFREGDLNDELAKVRKPGRVTENWSVGNRKTLEPGTRFFFIRQGAEPRGLVGSGWTRSAPYEAPHWDQDRAEQGKRARYAAIRFDIRVEEPIITMKELKRAPFSEVHWSTQMSGIRIAALVALKLEDLWAERTSGGNLRGMEELHSLSATARHHSMRVFVNRYERCPRMRALCLKKYGMKCVCCEIRLADIYGDAAAKLIHVHHLSPLASIPPGEKIDAIRDLRPVCPNCHSVIHSRTDPFSIDEVRAMMAAMKRMK